ncbi:MAG: NAD+ synthase [Chloroflexota bacterium]|nr:NAD+ synthase [Chloroflexota bacterium]
MRRLRVALAQINPTVGDLDANTRLILDAMDEAAQAGADVVALPELAITGYPPEDLLFKRQFLDEADRRLDQIVAASGDTLVIVGTPRRAGGNLYNAAAVLRRGKQVAAYHKVFLPNYGVFDEHRYFARGGACPVLTLKGVRLGVCVCEDIWFQPNPATVARAGGAEVVVNINGSPYHRGKGRERLAMLAERARANEVALAYVNMVGGQDELVFDGQSLILDRSGALLARGPQFEEALLIADLDADAVAEGRGATPSLDALRDIGEPAYYDLGGEPDARPPEIAPQVSAELGPEAEVYAALVLGTRDYVRKSGFRGAVIGLSGGIDSALTTAIAADALGADAVTTFFMPSQYTSGQSYDDAKRLAANLSVRMLTVPIKGVFDAYLGELAPVFEERGADLTEENIQARIRGNLLMAASNKFGWIVLTTGNKSEMATGYSTLYGDLAGGFAVIKDVPKTLVRALALHLNAAAGREVVPQSIIDRPPTAELRPDQLDEDSLPPYEVLDPILEAYVERDVPVEELLASGAPPDAVARAVHLVDRSEYKRRQAPPGVKITARAFGRDRRLPLVNRFDPR